jgi:hypothetical protein
LLATLLTLLAAQALAETSSPPASGPPRVGVEQVFIAPSGEAFRVPANAPYPVADWFARADADHDGKLTEAEFTADFLRFVASLDLDHDGTIDGIELERYEAAMGSVLRTSTFDGNWGMKHEDDGDSRQSAATLGSYMADAPQGAGRFDLLRIPEPVAAMDTALNGRINRQEVKDAAEYRFSLLDKRQHGYLLLSELPESWAQRHRIDDQRRGKRSGPGGGHRQRGGSGGLGH